MSSRHPASGTAALAALVLFLCFAFNMLGRGVGDTFIVFLLPLSDEFGWKRGAVSSVYSIYLIVTGVSAPLTGMVLDRWGPRVVYPLGLALLGTGCLVAGHLHALWQFQAVIGFFNGVGVSMLGMVPASMLISRWFRDRMSTAMGIAYAGFGTGTLLIVPLAQYLIETHGWRETYRLIGFAVLALLPLVMLVPWRRIAEQGGRIGRGGATPDVPRGSPVRDAMRKREYWQLIQVFSFTALAMYAMLSQIVAYLVQMGLTPLEAATAFGLQGLLAVFGMTASGWSCDRFGYRATATASFASTLAGIALLVLMSFFPSRWLVVPFVLLFGISQGARGPIVASIAARVFRGPAFATIYGTIFTGMSIGAALGSWISGALYDATGGYRASFVFSMICIAIAAMPFWTRRSLSRSPR
ncbi:MAG TPA: MFS transporter [Usitatibacter sp.]|nr:MFS transporter [Usitatibacter sp.]